MNATYLQGFEAARGLKGELDAIDLDTALKGVLWGWNSVNVAQREHHLWVAQRTVNQRVFGGWASRVQRIARMFVLHALMQVGVSAFRNRRSMR